MNEIDRSILEKLRFQYKMIYIWHTEQGINGYAQRFQGRSDERYISFVNQLPSPNQADLEIILRTAKEVLSGCMEWAYGEKYKNEIPLYEAAKKIRTIYEEFENQNTEQNKNHDTKKLINRSSDKSKIDPDFIEVETNRSLNVGEYRKYIDKVYSDIPAEINNIGGRIVLSETNFEHEKNSDLKESNKIRFRNSKAMHFNQITDEESVVSLAQSGVISILSIKIGEN